jgi:biopolymer transport protein ExbD
MAQKRRFIDVWIVENNTVYREVPFTVVTDWIQQGRLLADDRVRPSGTAEWFPIGGSATFAPYVPKMEAHRAEDQAEALEAVQVDFTWKRRPEDEDEDVDMIPLIDVSLVLLIFFMMTAAVGTGLFDIKTPTAKHKLEEFEKNMKLWVGMDIRKSENGPVVANKRRPYYSLGEGGHILVEPTREITEVLKKLKDRIGKASGEVKVRIRADESLPVEAIKDMTVLLKNIEYEEREKNPAKRVIIVGEVQEIK